MTRFVAGSVYRQEAVLVAWTSHIWSDTHHSSLRLKKNCIYSYSALWSLYILWAGCFKSCVRTSSTLTEEINREKYQGLRWKCLYSGSIVTSYQKNMLVIAMRCGTVVILFRADLFVIWLISWRFQLEKKAWDETGVVFSSFSVSLLLVI
jgi:hypothetical protein